MQRIKLIRFSRTATETFGTIIKDGVPICQTLELPWKHNARNISCIPQGVYMCNKWNSESKGAVFRISNVSNRSGILIHIGNIHTEIEGCILVGMYNDIIGGYNAVCHSRKTIKKLYDILDDEFELEIIERF